MYIGAMWSVFRGSIGRMETTKDYKDYIGVIWGVFRDSNGIMEKKMETTGL